MLQNQTKHGLAVMMLAFTLASCGGGGGSSSDNDLSNDNADQGNGVEQGNTTGQEGGDVEQDNETGQDNEVDQGNEVVTIPNRFNTTPPSDFPNDLSDLAMADILELSDSTEINYILPAFVDVVATTGLAVHISEMQPERFLSIDLVVDPNRRFEGGILFAEGFEGDNTVIDADVAILGVIGGLDPQVITDEATLINLVDSVSGFYLTNNRFEVAAVSEDSRDNVYSVSNFAVFHENTGFGDRITTDNLYVRGTVAENNEVLVFDCAVLGDIAPGVVIGDKDSERAPFGTLITDTLPVGVEVHGFANIFVREIADGATGSNNGAITLTADFSKADLANCQAFYDFTESLTPLDGEASDLNSFQDIHQNFKAYTR